MTSVAWFKILMIALPASILLGPLACLAFFSGVNDIFSIYAGTSIQSEVYIIDWLFLFLGGGGLLGLCGLWLRFLFETRLNHSVGKLNYIVATCLIAGVVTGLTLLFMNGLSSFFRYMGESVMGFIWSICMVAIVLAGSYFAFVSLKPNKSPQPTADGGG